MRRCRQWLLLLHLPLLSFSTEKCELAFKPSRFASTTAYSNGTVLSLFAEFNGRLGAHRRHDAALVCGCGPSMNLVDARAAALIHAHMDVWTTNQFFFHHHLVPDFYHVEFKEQSFPLWEKYFLGNITKVAAYKNTIFIAEEEIRNGADVRFLMRVTNRSPGRLLVYNSLRKEARFVCEASDGAYTPRCSPLVKHCGASMTTVFHLIIAMGYKQVWLLGIDLKVPGHFWIGNPSYPPEISRFKPPRHDGNHPERRKYQLFDNRSTNRRRIPMHATAERGIVPFATTLFAHNNVKAFNLSPISTGIVPIESVSLVDIKDRVERDGRRSSSGRLKA